MSWIKLEKDLANDPRVLRMASRLGHDDVTLASRSRLVVIGALVTLWWYADTHIRDDDVLPLGIDQINQLVGLDGFCDLMPAEWLQILDADSVKLVGYLTHNGTTAKKRAVDQKRQERHRSEHNAAVTVVSRSRHDDTVTRPRPRSDSKNTSQPFSPATEPAGKKGRRLNGESPRQTGQNPRALGTNPKALGTNPRALGTNPRAAKNRSREAWNEVTAHIDAVNGTKRTWAYVAETCADKIAVQAAEQVGFRLIADRDKYTTGDLQDRFRDAYERKAGADA